jgi:hypothetical protein
MKETRSDEANKIKRRKPRLDEEVEIGRRKQDQVKQRDQMRKTRSDDKKRR